MRPIAPRTRFQEVSLARNQLGFYELTAAVIFYDDGSVGILTRWRLDDEERAAVARGEDLYLNLLTPDGRPQPMLLSVGFTEEEDE